MFGLALILLLFLGRPRFGRHLAFILIFLLAGSRYGFAQTACTPAWLDTALTEAAIQNAVDMAATNDVICLAAGSATFNTATIQFGTKAVEIRGHGTMPLQGSAGETIITGGATLPDQTIFFGDESTGGSTTISNIRFLANENTPISGGGGAYIGNRNTGPGTKPWIIHHNDFFLTNIPSATHGSVFRAINIGAHGGVIYRNKFTATTAPPTYVSNTGVVPIEHSIGDDGSWWASASTEGTADTTGYNNLYVENNYFLNFNVAMDAHTSARTAWRFNEMHNASTADHGYDSSNQGERHTELYNNNYYCDDAIALNAWIAQRGGTYMVFNNTFPNGDTMLCAYGGTAALAGLKQSSYRLSQCIEIGGWPGTYPDTYPVSHQLGWGWVNGTYITGVGSSTTQSIPGDAADIAYPTDGFQQSLEPNFLFANTNNGSGDLLFREQASNECRAMAYSNTGKGGSAATTLTIPTPGLQYSAPYANAGQDVIAVFADLVGGSTPTIDDSLGNMWSSPLAGGTNGSQRLTIWHSKITNGGQIAVTFHFGSSAAARAGTIVVMKGLTATPIDQNPATANATGATTFDAPTVGGAGGSALAQSNEIILGYYALNGPTVYNHSSNVDAFENDSIAVSAPDAMTVACKPCTGSYTMGINGTTGSTDTSNTTVAVSYRAVTSTGAATPRITDATSRNAVMGSITFKVTSNDNTNLDLQINDFDALDRETFTQASGVQTNSTTPFNGTTGTGWGTRANRPTTCTYNSSTGVGVAYWSTDQGSWNTSGSGGQGVLDKCTATNTWTDAVYVPYDYPHPLATVTGGSCTPDHLAFIQQPSDAVLGAVISPSPTIGVYDSGNVLCTDDLGSSVILTVNSGSCLTLGGTTTLPTEVSGIYTASNLTVATGVGSCTIKASAGMLTDAISSSFTISAAPPVGTGGGLKLKLRLKGFVN